MKVAVFLSSLEPLHGGGFTFQDEIFHSLMRLEGRHSFVIFSNLGEDETENFRSENLKFISLQHSLSSTRKSKWDRIRDKAVAKLARFRNRPQPTYDEWLKQALKGSRDRIYLVCGSTLFCGDRHTLYFHHIGLAT